MKENTAKDVEQFLAAFVDAVVDNNVELTDGGWEVGKNRCLLGELVHRSPPVGAAFMSDKVAWLLGISSEEVDDITTGWDGCDSTAPFVLMGRWLRVRYLARTMRRDRNRRSK